MRAAQRLARRAAEGHWLICLCHLFEMLTFAGNWSRKQKFLSNFGQGEVLRRTSDILSQLLRRIMQGQKYLRRNGVKLYKVYSVQRIEKLGDGKLLLVLPDQTEIRLPNVKEPALYLTNAVL